MSLFSPPLRHYAIVCRHFILAGFALHYAAASDDGAALSRFIYLRRDAADAFAFDALAFTLS